MEIIKQILKLIECGLQSPERLLDYLLVLERELENEKHFSLVNEIRKLKWKYSKISKGEIKNE